ncbi:MAG: hypothetical protein ABJA67_12730 [Chthonomonadales bacterium]
MPTETFAEIVKAGSSQEIRAIENAICKLNEAIDLIKQSGLNANPHIAGAISKMYPAGNELRKYIRSQAARF